VPTVARPLQTSIVFKEGSTVLLGGAKIPKGTLCNKEWNVEFSARNGAGYAKPYVTTTAYLLNPAGCTATPATGVRVFVTPTFGSGTSELLKGTGGRRMQPGMPAVACLPAFALHTCGTRLAMPLAGPFGCKAIPAALQTSLKQWLATKAGVAIDKVSMAPCTEIPAKPPGAACWWLAALRLGAVRICLFGAAAALICNEHCCCARSPAHLPGPAFAAPI